MGSNFQVASDLNTKSSNMGTIGPIKMREIACPCVKFTQILMNFDGFDLG